VIQGHRGDGTTHGGFIVGEAPTSPAITGTNRPPARGTNGGGAVPRVVVVGGGFGGLACAAALGKAGVRVTLIDRKNYHLFVPLLYQVATAALSPADIAQPIRRVLSRYKSVDVMMAEVAGVDTAAREVTLGNGQRVGYDRLVLATGSEYSYFGHDDWRSYAPGLKTVDNARQLRASILQAFEEAEITEDPARRQGLMTTIVVGGGPTGVEMAGAVAELVRTALARDFRHIDPRRATTLLVEAGPRILGTFPEDLAAYAQRELVRLGVSVRTNTAVQEIRPDGALIRGEFVAASTVVWGAGVRASPAASWLEVDPDRAGRIHVAPDLSVTGRDDVYAIGDTVAAKGEDGKPLPGLGQVAKQQGEHLGRALAKNLMHGTPVPPFRFRNRGNTAVIGRHAAVFDFGRYKLKGRFAWLLWAIVHVYLLIGFEKRVVVSIQWLWRYLTFQRGARLID
jgi:NADH dehydrogenase